MDDFKNELKLRIKPPTYRHFRLGYKGVNTLMTLFRIGRTQLNSHRFTIGLSDTDRCLCGSIESPIHYYLDCNQYQSDRIKLVDKLVNLIPNFKNLKRQRQLDIILNGIIHKQGTDQDPRNRIITFAVQNFLVATNRFKR